MLEETRLLEENQDDELSLIEKFLCELDITNRRIIRDGTNEYEKAIIEGQKDKYLILLVEDQPSLRELFSSYFMSLNKQTVYSSEITGSLFVDEEHCMVTSCGVTDAISKVKIFNERYHRIPNITILDVLMPPINGDVLCKMLKSHKEYSHVPTYFWSTLSKDELKNKVKDSGAQGYFYKFDDMSATVKAIKEILSSNSGDINNNYKPYSITKRF